jgi:hypothetical protein
MSMLNFKGQPLIYAAIRFAMDRMGRIPEGKYKVVDALFNLMHDFYWTDCPCPADRAQRRGQKAIAAEAA